MIQKGVITFFLFIMIALAGSPMTYAQDETEDTDEKMKEERFQQTVDSLMAQAPKVASVMLTPLDVHFLFQEHKNGMALGGYATTKLEIVPIHTVDLEENDEDDEPSGEEGKTPENPANDTQKQVLGKLNEIVTNYVKDLNAIERAVDGFPHIKLDYRIEYSSTDNTFMCNLYSIGGSEDLTEDANGWFNDKFLKELTKQVNKNAFEEKRFTEDGQVIFALLSATREIFSEIKSKIVFGDPDISFGPVAVRWQQKDHLPTGEPDGEYEVYEQILASVNLGILNIEEKLDKNFVIPDVLISYKMIAATGQYKDVVIEFNGSRFDIGSFGLVFARLSEANLTVDRNGVLNGGLSIDIYSEQDVAFFDGAMVLESGKGEDNSYGQVAIEYNNTTGFDCKVSMAGIEGLAFRFVKNQEEIARYVQDGTFTAQGIGVNFERKSPLSLTEGLKINRLSLRAQVGILSKVIEIQEGAGSITLSGVHPFTDDLTFKVNYTQGAETKDLMRGEIATSGALNWGAYNLNVGVSDLKVSLNLNTWRWEKISGHVGLRAKDANDFSGKIMAEIAITPDGITSFDASGSKISAFSSSLTIKDSEYKVAEEEFHLETEIQHAGNTGALKAIYGIIIGQGYVRLKSIGGAISFEMGPLTLYSKVKLDPVSSEGDVELYEYPDVSFLLELKPKQADNITDIIAIEGASVSFKKNGSTYTDVVINWEDDSGLNADLGLLDMAIKGLHLEINRNQKLFGQLNAEVDMEERMVGNSIRIDYMTGQLRLVYEISDAGLWMSPQWQSMDDMKVTFLAGREDEPTELAELVAFIDPDDPVKIVGDFRLGAMKHVLFRDYSLLIHELSIKTSIDLINRQVDILDGHLNALLHHIELNGLGGQVNMTVDYNPDNQEFIGTAYADEEIDIYGISAAINSLSAKFNKELVWTEANGSLSFMAHDRLSGNFDFDFNYNVSQGLKEFSVGSGAVHLDEIAAGFNVHSSSVDDAQRIYLDVEASASGATAGANIIITDLTISPNGHITLGQIGGEASVRVADMVTLMLEVPLQNLVDDNGLCGLDDVRAALELRLVDPASDLERKVILRNALVSFRSDCDDPASARYADLSWAATDDAEKMTFRQQGIEWKINAVDVRVDERGITGDLTLEAYVIDDLEAGNLTLAEGASFMATFRYDQSSDGFNGKIEVNDITNLDITYNVTNDEGIREAVGSFQQTGEWDNGRLQGVFDITPFSYNQDGYHLELNELRIKTELDFSNGWGEISYSLLEGSSGSGSIEGNTSLFNGRLDFNLMYLSSDQLVATATVASGGQFVLYGGFALSGKTTLELKTDKGLGLQEFSVKGVINHVDMSLAKVDLQNLTYDFREQRISDFTLNKAEFRYRDITMEASNAYIDHQTQCLVFDVNGGTSDGTNGAMVSISRLLLCSDGSISADEISGEAVINVADHVQVIFEAKQNCASQACQINGTATVVMEMQQDGETRRAVMESANISFTPVNYQEPYNDFKDLTIDWQGSHTVGEWKGFDAKMTAINLSIPSSSAGIAGKVDLQMNADHMIFNDVIRVNGDIGMSFSYKLDHLGPQGSLTVNSLDAVIELLKKNDADFSQPVARFDKRSIDDTGLIEGVFQLQEMVTYTAMGGSQITLYDDFEMKALLNLNSGTHVDEIIKILDVRGSGKMDGRSDVIKGQVNLDFNYRMNGLYAAVTAGSTVDFIGGFRLSEGAGLSLSFNNRLELRRLKMNDVMMSHKNMAEATVSVKEFVYDFEEGEMKSFVLDHARFQYGGVELTAENGTFNKQTKCFEFNVQGGLSENDSGGTVLINKLRFCRDGSISADQIVGEYQLTAGPFIMMFNGDYSCASEGTCSIEAEATLVVDMTDQDGTGQRLTVMNATVTYNPVNRNEPFGAFENLSVNWTVGEGAAPDLQWQDYNYKLTGIEIQMASNTARPTGFIEFETGVSAPVFVGESIRINEGSNIKARFSYEGNTAKGALAITEANLDADFLVQESSGAKVIASLKGFETGSDGWITGKIRSASRVTYTLGALGFTLKDLNIPLKLDLSGGWTNIQAELLEGAYGSISVAGESEMLKGNVNGDISYSNGFLISKLETSGELRTFGDIRLLAGANVELKLDHHLKLHSLLLEGGFSHNEFEGGSKASGSLAWNAEEGITAFSLNSGTVHYGGLTLNVVGGALDAETGCLAFDVDMSVSNDLAEGVVMINKLMVCSDGKISASQITGNFVLEAGGIRFFFDVAPSESGGNAVTGTAKAVIPYDLNGEDREVVVEGISVTYTPAGDNLFGEFSALSASYTAPDESGKVSIGSLQGLALKVKEVDIEVASADQPKWNGSLAIEGVVGTGGIQVNDHILIRSGVVEMELGLRAAGGITAPYMDITKADGLSVDFLSREGDVLASAEDFHVTSAGQIAFRLRAASFSFEDDHSIKYTLDGADLHLGLGINENEFVPVMLPGTTGSVTIQGLQGSILQGTLHADLSYKSADMISLSVASSDDDASIFGVKVTPDSELKLDMGAAFNPRVLTIRGGFTNSHLDQGSIINFEEIVYAFEEESFSAFSVNESTVHYQGNSLNINNGRLNEQGNCFIFDVDVNISAGAVEGEVLINELSVCRDGSITVGEVLGNFLLQAGGAKFIFDLAPSGTERLRGTARAIIPYSWEGTTQYLNIENVEVEYVPVHSDDIYNGVEELSLSWQSTAGTEISITQIGSFDYKLRGVELNMRRDGGNYTINGSFDGYSRLGKDLIIKNHLKLKEGLEIESALALEGGSGWGLAIEVKSIEGLSLDLLDAEGVSVARIRQESKITLTDNKFIGQLETLRALEIENEYGKLSLDQLNLRLSVDFYDVSQTEFIEGNVTGALSFNKSLHHPFMVSLDYDRENQVLTSNAVTTEGVELSGLSLGEADLTAKFNVNPETFDISFISLEGGFTLTGNGLECNGIRINHFLITGDNFIEELQGEGSVCYKGIEANIQNITYWQNGDLELEMNLNTEGGAVDANIKQLIIKPDGSITFGGDLRVTWGPVEVNFAIPTLPVVEGRRLVYSDVEASVRFVLEGREVIIEKVFITYHEKRNGKLDFADITWNPGETSYLTYELNDYFSTRIKNLNLKVEYKGLPKSYRLSGSVGFVASLPKAKRINSLFYLTEAKGDFLYEFDNGNNYFDYSDLSVGFHIKKGDKVLATLKSNLSDDNMITGDLQLGENVTPSYSFGAGTISLTEFNANATVNLGTGDAYFNSGSGTVSVSGEGIGGSYIFGINYNPDQNEFQGSFSATLEDQEVQGLRLESFGESTITLDKDLNFVNYSLEGLSVVGKSEKLNGDFTVNRFEYGKEGIASLTFSGHVTYKTAGVDIDMAIKDGSHYAVEDEAVVLHVDLTSDEVSATIERLYIYADGSVAIDGMVGGKAQFVFGPVRVEMEMEEQEVDKGNGLQGIDNATGDIYVTLPDNTGEEESKEYKLGSATISYRVRSSSGSFHSADLEWHHGTVSRLDVNYGALSGHIDALELQVDASRNITGGIAIGVAADPVSLTPIIEASGSGNIKYVFDGGKVGKFNLNELDLELTLKKGEEALATAKGTIDENNMVTATIDVARGKSFNSGFAMVTIQDLTLTGQFPMADFKQFSFTSGGGKFKISEFRGDVIEGDLIIGMYYNAAVESGFQASVDVENSRNIKVLQLDLKDLSFEVDMTQALDIAKIEGGATISYKKDNDSFSLSVSRLLIEDGELKSINVGTSSITYKGFNFTVRSGSYHRSSKAIQISGRVKLDLTGSTTYLDVEKFRWTRDGTFEIERAKGSFSKNFVSIEVALGLKSNRFTGSFSGTFTKIALEGEIDVGKAYDGAGKFYFAYLSGGVYSNVGIPIPGTPVKINSLGGKIGFNYQKYDANGNEMETGNPVRGTYVVGGNMGIGDLANAFNLDAGFVVQFSDQSAMFKIETELRVPNTTTPVFLGAADVTYIIPANRVSGKVIGQFKFPPSSGAIVNSAGEWNFAINPPLNYYEIVFDPRPISWSMKGSLNTKILKHIDFNGSFYLIKYKNDEQVGGLHGSISYDFHKSIEKHVWRSYGVGAEANFSFSSQLNLFFNANQAHADIGIAVIMQGRIYVYDEDYSIDDPDRIRSEFGAGIELTGNLAFDVNDAETSMELAGTASFRYDPPVLSERTISFKVGKKLVMRSDGQLREHDTDATDSQEVNP